MSVVCISTLLLFMAKYYATVWICFILLFPRTFEMFPLLAIVNNAAVDIYGHVFVWTYIFSSLKYIPRSGIAGSCGKFTFNYLRNHQIIFQSSCSILQSSGVYESSLTNTCLSNFSHPSRCKVVGISLF